MENQRGFIQRARALARDGRTLDARGVRRARQRRALWHHLYTLACGRPWPSYRAEGLANPAWREIRLPFPGFVPGFLRLIWTS